MFEILTVFLVYLFSLNIAAFFGVALLTLFFQIKKEVKACSEKNGQSILKKSAQKDY